MIFKINKITLTAISLLLFLGSCGVPQEDLNKLRSENGDLKRQLEECQFGAEKLLSQATSFFENKEYEKCKSEVSVLLKRHFGSNEAKIGKELVVKADLEIKKLAIVRERERVETEKKEARRLANATKKMRKRYDDMNETTWYHDRTSPRYTNYNGFYAYIGDSDTSNPWLRLRIQYVADDWLFIEKYIINVDGRKYTIVEEKYGEIETDNGSGEIWEWLDRSVDSDEYEVIKAVANGKKVKIRFVGKQYHKDRTITSNQKLALRNVIDAYEALGGRM